MLSTGPPTRTRPHIPQKSFPSGLHGPSSSAQEDREAAGVYRDYPEEPWVACERAQPQARSLLLEGSINLKACAGEPLALLITHSTLFSGLRRVSQTQGLVWSPRPALLSLSVLLPSPWGGTSAPAAGQAMRVETRPQLAHVLAQPSCTGADACSVWARGCSACSVPPATQDREVKLLGGWVKACRSHQAGFRASLLPRHLAGFCVSSAWGLKGPRFRSMGKRAPVPSLLTRH